MARQKGTFNLGSNIENLAAAPLDARMLVKTKADLTDANSFPYFYQGMIVAVQSENKVYLLIDTDPTLLTSWKEIGATTDTQSVIEGYFNPLDELFYEESTYTTPITGVSETIYISLDTNESYRYNGTIFVGLDVSPIDDLQKPVMPEAVAGLVGKVYQYIGDTTTNYVKGYFYECIEDETNPGTYEWEEIQVQPEELPIIQVDIMPAPDETWDGRIIHYVGITTEFYTRGYFYECVYDSVDDLYNWINIDVQPVDLPVIQVWTIPTADSSWNERVVQYVGDTDANYHKGYFYECVETGIAGTYEWININVQAGSGGGGSDPELTKAITAAIDVGGISKGTNYPVGTEIERVLQDLLEPTLYPTYVSPSASITYSANNYYAVGSTIPAKTATVTFNPGTINLNGTKQNNRAGAATSYDLETYGADTDYTNTGATSGTFSIPALTKSTKGTLQIVATVDYAQGPQPKDSKGNDYDSPLPADQITATKTMNFILNFYYGASSNGTIPSLSGLTADTTPKGNKTYKYTTNNQYMVFAYDSDYGSLKNILDSNGFETISGWTQNTLTVNGFSYYVYVTKTQTTDTNAAFTFKF